jgi:hypothetical protein
LPFTSTSTGVPVELKDRALAEREQVADRERGASELDRDRERHLEQQPDVRVGAGVAVERHQRRELDLLDHRLAAEIGGRLLEQELLDRRLVEAACERAELGLDGRLLDRGRRREGALGIDIDRDLDLDDVLRLEHVLDLVHDGLLMGLRIGHWIAKSVK